MTDEQGMTTTGKTAEDKDKQPEWELDKEYNRFSQELLKLKTWILDKNRSHESDTLSTQRLYIEKPDTIPILKLVPGECGERYTSIVTQYKSGLDEREEVSAIRINPNKNKTIFAKMSKNHLAQQKADVVITAKGDAKEVLRKISRKHLEIKKTEHGYVLTCFTYDGCPIIEENNPAWRILKSGEPTALENVKFIALDIEKRIVLKVSFDKTATAEKVHDLDWYRTVMELKTAKGIEQKFGYLEIPLHAKLMKGPTALHDKMLLLNRFFTSIGTDQKNNVSLGIDQQYRNLNSGDNKFYSPYQLIDPSHAVISWENGIYYISKSTVNQTGLLTYVNYKELGAGESRVLMAGDVIHIGPNEQVFFIFREHLIDPSKIDTFEDRGVMFTHIPNFDCPALEGTFGFVECPGNSVLEVTDHQNNTTHKKDLKIILNKYSIEIGTDRFKDVQIEIDPRLKDNSGNYYLNLLKNINFTITRQFKGIYILTSHYKGGMIELIDNQGNIHPIKENKTAILPNDCLLMINKDLGLTFKFSIAEIKNMPNLGWNKAKLNIGESNTVPQAQSTQGQVPTSTTPLQDVKTAIITPPKKGFWKRMKSALSKKDETE